MISRSIVTKLPKINLKWYHSTASLNSSIKLDPLELHNHKDWLSPTEVIKIFETLKDPNSTLTVLNQLSKRKDYNPNEALYTSVVNNLSEAKNFDGIEEVMKRIKVEKRCRLSDGFFYNVIRIYGLRAGRINRAIETLFDMPNYSSWPTPKTFNFVLNLLVNTKQFDVIHEVYMGAGKLCVEIDACCLNIMMKGLCKNGDINAALQVFDEFPKQNCLRKNNRIEESIEVFEKMLLKGCEPIPSTYQEVLYALIDSKEYIKAMNLAKKMSSMKMVPSFDSYKLIIHGLCEEKNVEDIDLVLKHMIENGYLPKLSMWKHILQCILRN
ncbi:unnamed protein product [Lactuca saligna]|uniref:Pentacotripeptide-repeat region of PRORP domain-containing protein n=1 Tax=Lactuca saligna TaxID=75948 RepID=A0AA36A3E7_LACSI|nr:unnamed protein product [Lactuca saligna]